MTSRERLSKLVLVFGCCALVIAWLVLVQWIAAVASSIDDMPHASGAPPLEVVDWHHFVGPLARDGGW